MLFLLGDRRGCLSGRVRAEGFHGVAGGDALTAFGHPKAV